MGSVTTEDNLHLSPTPFCKGYHSNLPGGLTMITNEPQYAATKAQVARYRDALNADLPKGLPSKALAAMREGTQSRIDELEAQLAEYEVQKSGKTTTITVNSLRDISMPLITARLEERLSLEALAKRLNLPEKQIQHYEATGYAGISIELAQEVVDALNGKVNLVFTFEIG